MTAFPYFCRKPSRSPVVLILLSLAICRWELPAQIQEQLISSGSDWRWQKGTNEVSSPTDAWRGNGFDDAGWLVGTAPFHYGENLSVGTLLSDMRGRYTGIFLRRTFVVTNVSEIQSVRLISNDDDGFIAWINGTQVARARVNGQPVYTSVASGSHEAVPAETNLVANAPDSYLVVGTNVLAVQALNQHITNSSDFRFDTTLLITKLPPPDPNPPSVASAVPAAGSTVGSLTEITVNFSEPVTGVQASDLLVNEQPAASVLGSPGTNTYVFGFTQPPPGPVSVSWNEPNQVNDLTGSPFDTTGLGAMWSYTLADFVVPQVLERTPTAGAQVSQLTQVEITFNESVLGVNAADLLINNLPATSVLGSEAGPYLFQFPQPTAGTVSFSWVGNHGITDMSTTPNAFAGTNWTVTLNPNISTGDVVINEFIAGNISGLLDENGEAQDWIELYNRGSSAVNLLGWSLTDDRDVPGKWVFPSRVLNPGQYLVVFASGKDRRTPTGGNRFHTNFRLSPFGECLALFNAESPRVAVSEFTPQYPEQRNNYSFGLEGSNTWRYFQTPTPEAANGVSTIVGLAPPPHFSVERGFFDTPFNLLLTVALPGATIRYTTDGSEPTASTGQVYSGPLPITGTTVLRAAAFASGYLPSRTRTHSYVFLDTVLAQPNNPPGFPADWGTYASFSNNIVPADYEMDLDPLRMDPNTPNSPIDPAKLQRFKEGLRELPTVSIVMNLDDIFNPSGMYHTPNVTDKNFPDKPCSVEMLLPDGTTAFAVTAGLSMHGNASREPRKNPKHGFKLSFKSDFGESSLRYRLFPDSPAEEFDDLIVRADFGTSWRHQSDTATEGLGAFQRTRATRTRDAWWKDTMRDMGRVASHSRYCHLFINGLYWGTYDFSEQPTTSFAANYFGGADTDFDIYEQGALRAGSSAAYNAMTGLSNLGVNSNYELMKQYLDVTEYVDYLLLHYFVGAQDWGYDPNKNWYAIRKRVSGLEGTFKYLPWDGENLLLDPGINQVTASSSPSGLQQKLRDNAQYRLDFADRVHKHMIAPGGALTLPANVARWNKWLAIMDKPIVAESSRWGDYRRDVHNFAGFTSGAYVLYTREDQWLAESNRIVGSYLPGRNATVLGQLRSAGLYPAFDAPEFRHDNASGIILGSQRVAAGFVVALRNPGAGTIHFTTNGADPRAYYSGLVAEAAHPYTMPLTLNVTTTLKARVFNAGEWSALNEATFTIGTAGVPLAITEIMYNPIGGDPYEFVEVQNLGSAALDVGRFSFQGIDFIFPESTLLAPGAVIVLSSAANTNAFALRYPGVAVFGRFGGNLANGGERLSILDRAGQTVTTVHYDDDNGWPVEADGGGAALEVIDPRGDPNSPANWRASTGANGTPGLPSVAPTLGSVVINEIMADNLSAVTNGGSMPDWVELCNRGPSSVDLTGWSLSDDSNPRKFVLPNGTTLAAGGYLVVWCDTVTNTPGLHTGFALSRNGDNVFLYDAATNRVDALTFGLQVADLTVGRVGSDWQLGSPTPGSANSPVVLASATNLAINEWLANPGPGGKDWIELFNRASSAPVALRGLYLGTSNALMQFRSLSFLAPQGYMQLFADEQSGPDQLEFKLPASGGAIMLYDETAQEFQRVTYSQQLTDVSQGRLPDGDANLAIFNGSVSPGAANYLISWNGPMVNEILARNQRAAVTPWGGYADFIELFNPSGSAFDLAGFSVGTRTDGGPRWIFPAGASIAPGGYLLVWCDGTRPPTTASSAHLNTGFALDGESGDVLLLNALGQVVDRVSYGLQLQDVSIGRSAGTWQLLLAPSPGSLNSVPAPLGNVTALRINEWMASPLTGDDWFELFNASSLPVNLGGLFLTDHPSSVGLTNTQIAPLSFIGGQRWVKFIADGKLSAGRNHVNFALDELGETLRLYDATLTLIDAVDFGVQSTNVSQGRLPDGTATLVNFPTTPTQEESNFLPLTNVVINEVLAHTDPPLEDAVELYNPTASTVQIGGWYLSDSQSDLKRFRIPDGTVLAPGGYRVFYQNQFGPADGETDTPPLFTFNSAHGDNVFLSEADAGGNLTGYRTSVSFGASANGVSFGRHTTSVGVDFTALSQPTFGVSNPSSVVQFRTGTGQSNAYPLVGPVVISELMYHPSPTDTNDLDVADEEFIELHNRSGGPVPLYDPAHPENVWRLGGGVSIDFPANTSIAARGYLVVVPFDPVTNLAALGVFQSHYGSSAILVGPYSGKLNNAGDSVELYQPDSPQAPPHPDAGFVPYLLADRVAYSDQLPWPAAADGGGASLQRIEAAVYGNEPLNWKADSPTAGRTNSAVTGSAPVITVPPQNLSVIAGGLAEISVVASGSAPLHYQWLRNDQPLAGETATNLTIANVQTNHAGEYRVQITNDFGSVLSDPAANLTVLVPPSIAAPPQDQSVVLGSNALFTVAVSGTLPLHFQWQRNGSDLPGQTADSLVILGVQLPDATTYRVIVTNVAGAITSAPVSLAVLTPPSISAQPRSQVAIVGSAAQFSVSATGDSPLGFQWRFNGTNLNGATGPDLSLNNLKLADAGNYAVTVSNHAGLATSQEAVLWVIEAPVLSAPLATAVDEFQFDLAGPTSLRYLVEVSTNLLDWSTLGSFTSTNPVTRVVDQSAAETNRYYRASVSP